MARIRTIKPAFFTSEDICRVQPLGRLLFQGLWVEADRDGYLADSPFQLKTRILPADDCDVDALLWELVDAKLIRRFTASNGRHYIQILTFIEHQRPHPKEPRSTIPHDGEDRKRPVAMEKNGGQRMVPESIPSSPVGREGDLESGVLGREGNGTNGHPPQRQGLQTRGAFAPGSLPRDHIRHALCGGQMRLCLTENVYGKFVARYGGEQVDARKAIQEFVDGIEQEHESLGSYLWLDDHFTAFLRKRGRLKDAPKDAKHVGTSSTTEFATADAHVQSVRKLQESARG